jgi:hypothetical protein
MKLTNGLTNDMTLLIESQGKLFKVTHICCSIQEANQIMSENPNIAMICEDYGSNYIFLAEIEEYQLTKP